MADRMAAEIVIGGVVRKRLVRQLCGAIAAEHLAIDWDGDPFSPVTAADLLKARIEVNGVSLLRLSHHEASCGQFADLEQFLRAHEIAFDRFTDGKYEFDPHWIAYRPHRESRYVLTSASREPLVRTSTALYSLKSLQQMATQLRKGQVRSALASLTTVIERLNCDIGRDIRPLRAFRIG